MSYKRENLSRNDMHENAPKCQKKSNKTATGIEGIEASRSLDHCGVERDLQFPSPLDSAE
jgi:hypothetical protein